MAKRRTPPRYKSGPKKGQFMSKRARSARSSGGRKRRKRRNPGRTVQRSSTAYNPPKRRKRRRASVARRPAARKRRRTYKRNMPRRRAMGGIVRTLTDAVVDAGQVLIGKAAARSIPDLIPNVSKQGNMGLAVQAGTALVIGYVADMFLSKQAARAMTAGALTAPLETLIVANRVPWLSQALAPVTAQNGVQAYVRGGGGRGNLGRYARRPRLAVGSPDRGLGRYATERGMAYGYQ